MRQGREPPCRWRCPSWWSDATRLVERTSIWMHPRRNGRSGAPPPGLMVWPTHRRRHAADRKRGSWAGRSVPVLLIRWPTSSAAILPALPSAQLNAWTSSRVSGAFGSPLRCSVDLVVAETPRALAGAGKSAEAGVTPLRGGVVGSGGCSGPQCESLRPCCRWGRHEARPSRYPLENPRDLAKFRLDE